MFSRGDGGRDVPTLLLTVISDLGNAATSVKIIFTGKGTVMDVAAVRVGFWLTFGVYLWGLAWAKNMLSDGLP